MEQVNIKVFNGFEALQAEFKQNPYPLVSTSSEDIFCTLAWFENLALHGLSPDPAKKANTYLLLASDPTNGNWICLPLLSSAKLTSLSNYYSSLFGPVAWYTKTQPESVQPVDQMICNVIASHLHQAPSRWPIVTLSPLDIESSFYQHMAQALTNAGYWVDRFFCFGNWYLEVASRSFGVYYAGLPSALRHSIERGQRRLTKKGDWRVHIQQSVDSSLDASIADFVDVYNQSWKGPEPNAQFIPGLIRMAATRGWLRLGVLKLDDHAVAAQLWLVKDKKASIYKLAYVKGFEQFSAGSVLTSALMRQVVDVDQVKEVDYLTGDDPYKRDWMSHRRERWGIVAFHPGTMQGVLSAVKHFGGNWLHKVISKAPSEGSYRT